MEIIGKFFVKSGKIEAPPGIEGEFLLELNKNGSFIYRPLKPTPVNDLAFEVYDESGIISPVSFSTEAKATEYKIVMEKAHNRHFRMKKVFPGAEKNKKIVEEE
jgi:hypothetical protein